jgi:FtsZ-binding cell division protein ZapB
MVHVFLYAIILVAQNIRNSKIIKRGAREMSIEALPKLEKKIQALVTFVKSLKADNQTLLKENQELKSENARLTKENNQLTTQLVAAEARGTTQLEETKVMVDDLIKNIDALVKNEHPA